ncbi:hypothetical protein GCM10027167_84640 [Nocardia heshunensis]
MAVLLFVAFSVANVLSALIDGRVHAQVGEMFRYALHHPVLPAITAVIVAALWFLLQRRFAARH